MKGVVMIMIHIWGSSVPFTIPGFSSLDNCQAEIKRLQPDGENKWTDGYKYRCVEIK